MRILHSLVAMAVMSFSANAAAQDARTERVSFDGDETVATIHGSIAGEETVEYLLPASAGQSLVVVLNPSNAATYFNIFQPGSGPGDQAMYVGSTGGNQYLAALPATGDYTVQVYLMRSAARRDETSDYRLDIGLDGDGSARQPSGDYADGLSGGPDFWQVSVSGSLNIRSAPSTGASVLIALPDGTVLRNLGCREAEDRVWCEVAQPDGAGVRGWAAGSFLVETAPVDQAATPTVADVSEASDDTDALVPGTPYHATGTIHCAPSMDAPAVDCGFGVIRAGSGSGSVEIELPDGGRRTIRFEAGEAVSSDAPGPLTFTRVGDTMIINIGPEHYEMPDAVIFGG